MALCWVGDHSFEESLQKGFCACGKILPVDSFQGEVKLSCLGTTPVCHMFMRSYGRMPFIFQSLRKKHVLRSPNVNLACCGNKQTRRKKRTKATAMPFSRQHVNPVNPFCVWEVRGCGVCLWLGGPSSEAKHPPFSLILWMMRKRKRELWGLAFGSTLHQHRSRN